MDEPAVIGVQMPSESKREDASLLIPADVQIPSKGDASGLLLREPICVTLGDTSCN
jgi:hypothetical protein